MHISKIKQKCATYTDYDQTPLAEMIQTAAVVLKCTEFS